MHFLSEVDTKIINEKYIYRKFLISKLSTTRVVSYVCYINQEHIY